MHPLQPELPSTITAVKISQWPISMARIFPRPHQLPPPSLPPPPPPLKILEHREPHHPPPLLDKINTLVIFLRHPRVIDEFPVDEIRLVQWKVISVMRSPPFVPDPRPCRIWYPNRFDIQEISWNLTEIICHVDFSRPVFQFSRAKMSKCFFFIHKSICFWNKKGTDDFAIKKISGCEGKNSVFQ